MDILAKVTAVVAEVLELDPAQVGADADLMNDLGMDSVLAIDITTALEKHYRVKVPDARMEELTTPNAIVAVIEELLSASPAR